MLNEAQGPPTYYLFLLKDTAKVGVRGVGGEGKVRLGEWVHQPCGGSQGYLDGVERQLQQGRPVQHLGITFETFSQGLECVGGGRQETVVEVYLVGQGIPVRGCDLVEPPVVTAGALGAV